jgi:hypothetical protein
MFFVYHEIQKTFPDADTNTKTIVANPNPLWVKRKASCE